MRKIPDEKILHVQRLLGKGLPQAEIARIVGVSVGLVNKIKKGTPATELPARVSPPKAEDAESVPEVLPEGIAVEVVDKWIPKVEAAITAAEGAKDYAAMSSLMAKLVALLEHKRKATPDPRPDPNDNPDMIEAARRVRGRWYKLLEGMAGR